MFRNVCNCLSISRHLTLVSYENYYNTLFFLKQSALFLRYLRAVKLPPQNSAETKKLGKRLTALKPDWFN